MGGSMARTVCCSFLPYGEARDWIAAQACGSRCGRVQRRARRYRGAWPVGHRERAYRVGLFCAADSMRWPRESRCRPLPGIWHRCRGCARWFGRPWRIAGSPIVIVYPWIASDMGTKDKLGILSMHAQEGPGDVGASFLEKRSQITDGDRGSFGCLPSWRGASKIRLGAMAGAVVSGRYFPVGSTARQAGNHNLAVFPPNCRQNESR